MGNCTFVVKTVGSHHNGLDTDVDMMAAEFVKSLRAAGHSVVHAGITAGGEYDLVSDPEKYQADMRAVHAPAAPTPPAPSAPAPDTTPPERPSGK